MTKNKLLILTPLILMLFLIPIVNATSIIFNDTFDDASINSSAWRYATTANGALSESSGQIYLYTLSTVTNNVHYGTGIALNLSNMDLKNYTVFLSREYASTTYHATGGPGACTNVMYEKQMMDWMTDPKTFAGVTVFGACDISANTVWDYRNVTYSYNSTSQKVRINATTAAGAGVQNDYSVATLNLSQRLFLVHITHARSNAGQPNKGEHYLMDYLVQTIDTIDVGNIISVYPTNEQLLTNGNLTIYVILNANNTGTNISFTINNVLNSTQTINAGNNQQINNTNILLSEGLYNLTVNMLYAGIEVNYFSNFTINTSASMLFSQKWPANNTQFSYSNVDFNLSVSNNATNINVTLYIDNILYGTQNKTMGVLLFNWSNVILTEGTHNYYMLLNNSISQINTTNANGLFYIDTLSPSSLDNFNYNNKPIPYGKNITVNFTFNDAQSISSWNVSVDGIPYSINTSLSQSEYNISVFIPWINLSTHGFNHSLYVRVADGHTANKIPNWKVSEAGMFKTGITYEDPNTGELIATITAESMSDRMTTTKLPDRYIFDFKPRNKNKGQYVFIVETKYPMMVVNRPDLLYNKWITFGNHWLDFVYNNKVPNLDIELLSATQAKVTIYETNPTDIFKFSSIGDLNIVDYTYTFYTYNVTITDQDAVTSAQPYTATIFFNKGVDVYNMSNIERTYNSTEGSTPLNSVNGTLVTRTPINETWTIPYISLGVASTLIIPTNFSWSPDGGTTFASANWSQMIYQLSLSYGNCTNNMSKVLNFLMYDEEYDANTSAYPYVNSSLNIWLELSTIVGYSVNVSVAFRNDWNYSICMYPNSSVAVGNSIMEYYAPGYANRKYYLLNFTLSNVTQTIYLWLVNGTKYTNVQMKVYNKADGTPVPGAYIQVLRYYPELGGFRTVEIEKTDNSGYAIGKLIPYDIFYKFNVIYNGLVKLQTDSQTIYTTTKYLPISLSEDVLRSLQYEAAVARNISCVESTRTCTFVWVDLNGLVDKAILKIYRQNGWGTALIHESSMESAAGTLSYTITEDMNNSVYKVVGTIDTNTRYSIYDIITYFSGHVNIKSQWGESMIFGMMILVIAASLFFIDIGVTGIVAGSITAMAFGWFMGWISLTWGMLISLIIIGGILISRAIR